MPQIKGHYKIYFLNLDDMEKNERTNIDFEEIIEENLQTVFLNCMADFNLRSILFSIIDEPKSMLQICQENNIPLRTVYRKIQYLLDNKLLKISGAISYTGKKFFLYKSKIRAISTKIDDSNILSVHYAPNISIPIEKKHEDIF